MSKVDAYAAFRPCGCMTSACTGTRDRLARKAAEWIRAGYIVRPVTDDEVRAQFNTKQHAGECPPIAKE